jgi:hypothetical protein
MSRDIWWLTQPPPSAFLFTPPSRPHDLMTSQPRNLTSLPTSLPYSRLSASPASYLFFNYSPPLFCFAQHVHLTIHRVAFSNVHSDRFEPTTHTYFTLSPSRSDSTTLAGGCSAHNYDISTGYLPRYRPFLSYHGLCGHHTQFYSSRNTHWFKHSLIYRIRGHNLVSNRLLGLLGTELWSVGSQL